MVAKMGLTYFSLLSRSKWPDKLKLDMSCHPLNVHTKFQIDIPKHVEKSPENSDRRTDRQMDIATA